MTEIVASGVARDEERETGARECEVDEVTGETVGRFLDRGGAIARRAQPLR